MIKAILFDIDNVLISNNTKESFSNRFTQDTVTNIETILEFIRIIYSKCKLGQADLKKELSEVSTSWNWKGSLDSLIEYWYTPKALVINKELITLIDSLRSKGTKSFIVSNNEKYRAEILLNKFSLNKHMDGCFFSYDLGYLKNTPEFWLKLINTTQYTTNEMLLVDDKVKNINMAKSMGFRTIIFEDNQKLKHKLIKTYKVLGL